MSKEICELCGEELDSEEIETCDTCGRKYCFMCGSMEYDSLCEDCEEEENFVLENEKY